LQYDPRLAEAYHLRGKARVLDSREAAAPAIDDFSAAIRQARGFAEAYFDRGLLELETGAVEPAIADFNEAARLGPPSRDLSFYRGMALLQNNQPKEAVVDFSAAIRSDADDADAYLNRGIALYRLGQPREALADYERALAINPRSGRAYLNRGAVRLTLGDAEGALADCDLAIQHARRAGDVASLAPAYFNRGRAFYLKHDYARAIDDWERVARNLDDRDCMTLDHLGLAYGKLQNEARAARYFEDAVRLDDTRSYAPAHAHLGAVRYKQKDYEGAVKECTTAIEIDPTLGEAYATRGRAQQALGRLADAQADAKRAEELRKKGP
jgi:tetratricopeptide (TPR) repeat protein